MARVQQLDVHKVQQIVTLGRHDDAKARSLLQQIADQVQPIMRRRRYTCPLLTEFFPSNPNLLGLNVGGGGGNTSKICIRLRPARDERSFMDYESLLGTMLHELAHNMVSPHNVSFYKLLDELRKECEQLMAAGVRGTGAGFDAPAAGRAGGIMPFGAHDQHYDARRATLLQATDQRMKKQQLMSAGPQRLGGGGGGVDWRSLDPGQAAALAAERRAADAQWCGGGHDEASTAPAAVGSADGSGRGVQRTALPSNDDDVVVVVRVVRPEEWACRRCTFLNKSTSAACEICGTVAR